MASETVVQAGGSTEQQPQAAAQAMPVDLEKLRASLTDVLTRADVLLSMRQGLATESGFDALVDLDSGMYELSHNLAYAIVGHHVLGAIHTQLRDRARAVIEVCEMPEDLHSQYFGVGHSDMWALLLEGCEVPERWRKRFLGEDIPY